MGEMMPLQTSHIALALIGGYLHTGYLSVEGCFKCTDAVLLSLELARTVVRQDSSSLPTLKVANV